MCVQMHVQVKLLFPITEEPRVTWFVRKGSFCRLTAETLFYSLDFNSLDISDCPKWETRTSMVQLASKDSFKKNPGNLMASCVHFFCTRSENCSNLLHKVSSQWSEWRNWLHLVPGLLQMKNVWWCFFFFWCQMKTNSNACWRASLFHRFYCSTRTSFLNLSKLFTCANRRNVDILFPHSVPQFTNRKLWKRETRNQSFCVRVSVYVHEESR